MSCTVRYTIRGSSGNTVFRIEEKMPPQHARETMVTHAEAVAKGMRLVFSIYNSEPLPVDAVTYEIFPDTDMPEKAVIKRGDTDPLFTSSETSHPRSP